jgi:hypothetical protein
LVCLAGNSNSVNWGSKPGTPEPKLWQHDIFHADGTPFNEDEVRFIKGVTGAQTHLKPALLN